MKIIETSAFLSKKAYPHYGTQPGFATPSSGGLVQQVLAPGDGESADGIKERWGRGKKKKKKKKKRPLPPPEEMPQIPY